MAFRCDLLIFLDECENFCGVVNLKNSLMKMFWLLAASFALFGCAQQPLSYIRWISNSNATQEQFMRDRYQCLSETQQRVSQAFINQYGGASNSAVMPSCSAFNACLGAKGYFRSDTTNLADFNRPGSLSVPQSAVISCQP